MGKILFGSFVLANKRANNQITTIRFKNRYENSVVLLEKMQFIKNNCLETAQFDWAESKKKLVFFPTSASNIPVKI